MSTTGDEDARDAAVWPAAAGPTPATAPSLKGLWIDTIVQALRRGTIDLAVHSAKDLPAGDEEGLAIVAVPRREDPRDVIVTRAPDVVLGDGTVVGTSSLRRAAQLRATSPGVEIRELRGNVDTRLRKLFEGSIQAVVLAAAGLRRLGVEPANARPLGPEEMIPAPGQGALAIQCREDDRPTRAWLSLIDHAPSHVALDAERALTRRLEAGCDLPLGALARERSGGVDLVAIVASPDGAHLARAAVRGPDPETAADRAERTLMEEGAGETLAAIG
jgi:hydroxymethylbilane synthase